MYYIKPEEEKRVRRQLATRLGIQRVPNEVWDELLSKHYDLVYYAALGGDKGLTEDLLPFAKSLHQVWHSRKGQKRRRARSELPNEFVPELDHREELRAAACEEYLAKVASAHPDVYIFRTKVLGERLLDAEEARGLLTSEAARFLSRSEFEEDHIPIVGHHATLEKYEQKREGEGVLYLATVHVDPPGIEKVARVFIWGPVSVWSSEDGMERLRGLTFPGGDGYVESIEVWARSLLGELHRLSDELAKTYEWQPAQATWFILTGAVPARPPVRMRYSYNRSRHHAEGVISFQVTPWVSADTVLGAFRDLQRQVLDGRDNQPIRERNLRLLRFVNDRMNPTAQLEEDLEHVKGLDRLEILERLENLEYAKYPTGRELAKEWDRQEWVQENPEERAYGRDTGRLWRDYHRARRAMAFPQHKLPDEL